MYYSSTTLYDKVALVIDRWHKRNVIYNARRNSTHPPTSPCKMTRMIDPWHIRNIIYNAQSNSTHPPTSPNTAPAKQNDTHDWFPSHMKRHVQCAQQQESPSNCTKYWACRAKWLSWLTMLTYETSFTMRGPTGITLQSHQILRLPHSKTQENFATNDWSVIYNGGRFEHFGQAAQLQTYKLPYKPNL